VAHWHTWPFSVPLGSEPTSLPFCDGRSAHRSTRSTRPAHRRRLRGFVFASASLGPVAACPDTNLLRVPQQRPRDLVAVPASRSYGIRSCFSGAAACDTPGQSANCMHPQPLHAPALSNRDSRAGQREGVRGSIVSFMLTLSCTNYPRSRPTASRDPAAIKTLNAIRNKDGHENLEAVLVNRLELLPGLVVSIGYAPEASKHIHSAA